VPRYADLTEFLIRAEAAQPHGSDLRQPLTAATLERLRRKYPELPEDYAAYLAEIGWGSLLRNRYMIYAQPASAAERLGPQAAAQLPESMLCFGDNMAGDIAGFLPEAGWSIVEIHHLTTLLEPVGQDFAQFIRERAGMDDDLDSSPC
jgi:hypothetical protein